MNEFRVRIPFFSKNFTKNKNNNKFFLKGFLNYVFDLKVKKQWGYLEIEEGAFRVTDVKHMEQSAKKEGYYASKIVREFRENILNKIVKYDDDSYINKKGIIQNQKIIILNEKNIKVSNKFLKTKSLDYFNSNKKYSLKSQYTFFTGSNISGAKQNPLSSPIISNDEEYTFCRVLNVFDEFEKDFKINFNNLKILNKDILSLSDLVNNEIVIGFSELFFKVNYIFVLNQESNLVNNEIYFEENMIGSKNLIDKNNDEINNSIKKCIEEFRNKNLSITTKGFKKILRSKYTLNVLKNKSKNIINGNNTNKKFYSQVLQNAHIIKFSTLFNEGKYEEAIDGQNCIRINADTHLLFDNNIITFNERGDLVKQDSKEIIEKKFLLIDSLTPKQKALILENWNHFLVVGENK